MVGSDHEKADLVAIYVETPQAVDCIVDKHIGKMAVGVSLVGKMKTDLERHCIQMCWKLRSLGCYSINYHPRSSSCSFLKFYTPNPAVNEHIEMHPGYFFIAVLNCSGAPVVTTTTPVIPPPYSPVNPLNPACGIPKVQPHMKNNDILKGKFRIVNGTEAIPHSLPWQVAVKRTGSYICTGVLVDAVTVITAAHCVSIDIGEKKHVIPIDAKEFSVELGVHSFKTNAGVQRRGLKALRVYEEFDFEESVGDMAILHLSSPIIFTNDVMPVCLPKDKQDVFVGEKCIVAGWGLDSEYGKKSDVLMQLVVPVLDPKLCTSKDSYGKEVKPEYMICAGYMEGYRDSCQGDSGGPLLCRKDERWFTQGVVSFGSGCARKNKPGVYTRLARFRPWILKTMADLAKIP
ncbi:unnamed protein product [Soboliphyme baturini]|uniref:Peptidase S1 domain-containing protein n=1 Tax=Soboliphyme baturini TaxID=241478 RepID=A0A183IEZ4_9BILA|nr:unnamed protein product [Soboliphyme baturini]